MTLHLCFDCQDGEQCTGGGDEINPCVDTENTHSRTVDTATGSCNIVLQHTTRCRH